MSAGAAPPRQRAVAAPAASATPDGADSLTPREATLRSAATACLAGLALLQAIKLPALLTQRPQFAVLSVAALALCASVTIALVVAPAGASRPVWRVVAATAVLLLAGWAAPHAVSLPGLGAAPGDWTAMPGALDAIAAAACLALAALAMRLGRAAVRGLATALAVLVALGPGVGVLLVALGPGSPGGETAISADVHVHAHSIAPEQDIVVRRGPKGAHYLTPVATRPRAPAAAVALVAAGASVFLLGAFGYLRGRVAPVGDGLA